MKDYLKIFLLIILVFLSCDSNPVSDEKNKNTEKQKHFNSDSLSVTELEALILGNWEWTHSIIMSRNLPPPDNKITPASEGFTMSRFFDSKTVTYFNNKSMLNKVHYKIEKFKMLSTDKVSYNIIKIEIFKKRLFFLHSDTLMIGDGWSDGINEFYTRKNNT